MLSNTSMWDPATLRLDVRSLLVWNRDRFVTEYEAEFLRLNRYTRALIITEYDKCVRFEEGLQYELTVLIAF